MPAYVTIRVPHRIAALDIGDRSERLHEAVLGAVADDLGRLGAPFGRRSGPTDRICAAFHANDAVLDRIRSARDAARRAGRAFSTAALVTRLL